jgi:hypothetical protein
MCSCVHVPSVIKYHTSHEPWVMSHVPNAEYECDKVHLNQVDLFIISYLLFIPSLTYSLFHLFHLLNKKRLSARDVLVVHPPVVLSSPSSLFITAPPASSPHHPQPPSFQSFHESAFVLFILSASVCINRCQLRQLSSCKDTGRNLTEVLVVEVKVCVEVLLNNHAGTLSHTVHLIYLCISIHCYIYAFCTSN